MTNPPWAIVVTDHNGVARLSGKAKGNPPPPTPTPPYVPPTAREIAGGAPLNIANGGDAYLPWAHGGGDAIFNYADPTEPKAVVSGIYSITANVAVNNLTAGGFYVVKLRARTSIGGIYYYAEAVGFKPVSPSAPGDEVAVGASLTTYLAAGDGVSVEVHSFDGAASRDFSIQIAFIQRIT